MCRLQPVISFKLTARECGNEANGCQRPASLLLKLVEAKAAATLRGDVSFSFLDFKTAHVHGSVPFSLEHTREVPSSSGTG